MRRPISPRKRLDLVTAVREKVDHEGKGEEEEDGASLVGFGCRIWHPVPTPVVVVVLICGDFILIFLVFSVFFFEKNIILPF